MNCKNVILETIENSPTRKKTMAYVVVSFLGLIGAVFAVLALGY